MGCVESEKGSCYITWGLMGCWGVGGMGPTGPNVFMHDTLSLGPPHCHAYSRLTHLDLEQLDTMFLFSNYSLRRNPLSLSVPLDGSETVRGLRALERAKLVSVACGEVTQPAAAQQHVPPVPMGRRLYQRYRGPYLEQLTLDDLQAEPKPWGTFAGGGAAAYSVPANMAVLQERLEENLVAYLPNYLRLSLAILLLVMYLRPAALLGTVAVAGSVFLTMKRTLQRQAEQLAAQQEGGAAGARGRGGGGGNGAAAGAAGAAATEQEQLPLTLLSTLGTWFIAAYTRCLPMILLSLGLSAIAVFLHAASRAAPSEARYRGKQPLGYSVWEVLGRAAPPRPGSDPRLVFKQLWWLQRGWVERKARQAAAYVRYWVYVVRDTLQYRRLR